MSHSYETPGTLFESLKQHVNFKGTCDEATYLKHLGNALRLLWNRKDWLGSIERAVLMPTPCGEFVLPWELQTIRSAWVNNCPIEVQNGWWETLGNNTYRDCRGDQCELIIDSEKNVAVPTDWINGRPAIEWHGNEDEDTEITLSVKDANGALKNFKILYNPDVQSTAIPVTAAQIVGVVKGRTRGAVNLYSWTESGGYFHQATYMPQQVNPIYTVYRKLQDGSDKPRQVVIRAKKRLILPSTMDDPLPIDNVIALAFSMQAWAQVGKDNESYVSNLTLAEEVLNEDREDQFSRKPQTIQVEGIGGWAPATPVGTPSTYKN